MLMPVRLGPMMPAPSRTSSQSSTLWRWLWIDRFDEGAETGTRGGAPPALITQPTLSYYRGVGRGCGVGRGLGVTLGVALGVGVTLGVDEGVGVADGVGVALGEGVGVGVGGTPPGNGNT